MHYSGAGRLIGEAERLNRLAAGEVFSGGRYPLPTPMQPSAPGSTRAASPARTAGYIAACSLAGALCVAIVLTAMWASQGLESAIRGRAADVVTRIALKPNVSEESARRLATRLREGTRGLEVTVIGEADARTLLALQEPWMKDLPEVQVGRLPVLLEVRHPARYDSPGRVRAFNSELEALPEADFVEFNSIGYEGMVGFVRNVRAYSRYIGALLVALSGALYVVASLGAGARRARAGLGTAVAFAVAVTALGCTGGFVLHLFTSAFASSRYYALPPLGPPSLLAVGGAAFAVCLLLEMRFLRRARPAHPKAPAE